MEREITIRLATLPDLPAVLEVQRQSPQASQWSEKAYVGFLPAEDKVFLLAEEAPAGRMVGFLLARAAADELEVLNLAVVPELRRQGMARRLLHHALARSAAQGVGRCWLEVRASNHAALAFYRALGFTTAQRRPRYYREPEEDAIVCVRGLSAEVAP